MHRNQFIPLLSWVLATLVVGCDSSSSGSTSSARASLGCTDGSLDSSVEHIEIEFGGTMRSYELHVPPAYDGSAPLPLVLNFHGFTSSGSEQQGYTMMDDTADANGFIVAYPNGLSSSWNAGICCGEAAMNGVDDVGFTRAIVDDLGARGCVDLSRIYATGMSNGGFMSHRLACEASDLIAAIAPVSGVLGLEPSSCDPARAVPLIHFHGTEDFLVPYDGGGLAGSISVPASTDFWIDHNGCSGEPTVTYSEGMVTCETIDQCAEGSSVTLCTIDGGGHCWPGEPCDRIEGIDLGLATMDINANDAMWALFSSVSLP